MNDDFDPRAGESSESKVANEFGDFETAFGGHAQSEKLNDGFADFTAAFSENQNNSQLMAGLPNVLPNVIPPPNMSSTVPNLLSSVSESTKLTQLGETSLISGSPAQPMVSNNNCDLLGDLSDFGSLSIQSQQQNFGLPPNNNPMSTSNDLLDSLSTGKIFMQCVCNE